MNYTSILRRSIQITWRHRALWLFGFLLALFGGSGGGSGGGGGGDGGSGQVARLFQYRLGRDDLSRFRLDLPSFGPSATVILAGVVLVIILLVVATIIVRNLSKGALIAMVDEVEETGNTRVSTGFRRGWRHWLRLFAISLVVFVPLVVAALILLAGAASPLLLAIVGAGNGAGAAGKALLAIAAVLTVGLFLVWLLLVIVASVAADLLQQFAYRRCVLGGDGVFAAIRHGYHMIRRNLRDAGLTWLILFGVQLVAGIVLIPVVLIGLALVAGPAVAAGVASQSWVVALLLAAPLFLLFIVAISFLSGLLIVFTSTVWTLTYREVLAREQTESEPNAAAPSIAE
ncbi:MAG: DUF7544 domain-containing protein [Anaerolineae bacterium]